MLNHPQRPDLTEVTFCGPTLARPCVTVRLYARKMDAHAGNAGWVRVTEQRERADGTLADASDAAVGSGAPSQLSRRSLLRGVTIAAPTILTLSSASAAVAATSIRTLASHSGAQADGNFYCLDEDTTLGWKSQYPSPAVVELQDPGAVDVYRIPPQDYVDAPNASGAPVDEKTMCEKGGDYFYHQRGGGWPGVRVKDGVLVSGIAMTSLGVTPLDVERI